MKLHVLVLLIASFVMPLSATAANQLLKNKLNEIWKTRPDLQKEFPSVDQKGLSGNWTMKDWYNLYGKKEMKNIDLSKPSPKYVKQSGMNEVYDVSDGLPRYVSYDEASKNDIWKSIKENSYLYSPYKGVEVYRKKETDADYPEYGKFGGYINFGKPTSKAFVKHDVPVEKMRAIVAHELGHFLTAKWYRDEYLKKLGYEDTNENDVISLSEKVANDYENYKMGNMKDQSKSERFKSLESEYPTND